MSHLEYRPEIDGIRALAVTSVLLYHMEYTFIPGGFVGVDVFFVISGYLITLLIYNDTSTGNFNFTQFYIGRIRRLAPALIVMLGVTFIVSAIYLMPDYFESLSGALVSSIFSVSNIFFWLESGYFDASAELKPLLHVWSLSVEEQFYFVWPALIFFCRPLSRRLMLAIFLMLGIASLVAARKLNAPHPSATFFLMPFRVYEFALGAGLAMLPMAGLIQGRRREPACLAGLIMVGYSLLHFDKTTPFPDAYALVPCVGAVLLIAGGGAPITGLLLRNPVSIWMGKISYSLYLVHWPIVVLYKHITYENAVEGKSRIALLVITVIAATILNQTVENRFRVNRGDRSIVGAAKHLWIAFPLLLVAVAGHAYLFNGWSGRFDQAVIAAIGNVEEKQQKRRQFTEGPDSLSSLPFDNESGLNILIMGDSHATDVFNALYLNLPNNNSISLRRLEMDDTCLYLFAGELAPEQSSNAQLNCEAEFSAVQASSLLKSAHKIIVSTRWELSSLQYLDEFSAYLQQDKRELIIMGRTAEFRNVPSILLKYGLKNDIRAQLANARDIDLDELNETLLKRAEELGLTFVNKLPFLCDLADKTCDVVDTQGMLLYTDYGHWSVEGARFFGKRMIRNNKILELLTSSSVT